MKHILNENGRLYRLLEMVMELGTMNLLFLLCSIPLFTIGPAYVGLLACADAFWKEEGSSTVRTFFRHFWAAFLPAVVLGLATALVLGLLVYNALFSLSVFSGTVRVLLLELDFLFFLLVLMYSYHVFRLLAHFRGFRVKYLKAAFLGTLAHLLRGVAIAAAALSPAVLLFLPLGVGLALLPVLLLFWFSTAGALCVRLSAGYLPQILQFCEES